VAAPGENCTPLIIQGNTTIGGPGQLTISGGNHTGVFLVGALCTVIRKPIEDLPSEWVKEDREIDGGKPDLAELDEDPSEL
jgi:hypothetical protein